MIRATLISLLFVLCVIFVSQNQEVFLAEFILSLDLFFYKFNNKDMPNSVLIIISFFLGVLICLISIGIGTIRKSIKIGELQKKITALETNQNSEVKKIDS